MATRIAATAIAAMAVLVACTPERLPSVQAGGVEPASIRGVVRDGSQPVGGAVVRIKGTARSTVAEADGRFVLDGLTPDRPLVVTAWAPGYYIGGGDTVQPGGHALVIPLKKHHDVDNVGYSWLPSLVQAGSREAGACAECHSREGTAMASPLPADEWQQDAHALSAVNARFLTMYEGSDRQGRRSADTRFFAVKDYGLFPVPRDPVLPYRGPGYRLDFPDTAGNCAACHTPTAAVNAPTGTDPRGLTGTAAEGVGCDVCHKVWEVRIDPATGLPWPNSPGVLSMVFRRPPAGHQFFAGPYDDVAPGEDTFAPVQRESRFCAPCHFGVFWDTVVYDSYGEWLRSPYSQPGFGRTCQDCHMPPLGAVYCARPDKGGIERAAATVFSHRMPGAADRELLASAVTLRLAASREPGRVTAQVTITNSGTGHHVPTDSPLRHLILLVSAGEDARLVEGPVLPAWCGTGNRAGHYGGRPGKAYARVLQDLWTGEWPTAAYWNPTKVVSDNRLAALTSDESTFVFTAPGAGSVTVKVSLLFRRAFIKLMEQKGWDVPDIPVAEATATVAAAGQIEGRNR